MGKIKDVTETEMELALYVYCCSIIEQDAFANELYQELNVDHPLKKDEENKIIHNSQAYSALERIRNTRDDIIRSRGSFKYNTEMQKYGKDKRWFINLGNNAEARLSEKIRKVYAKAKNDNLKNWTQTLKI